MPVSAAVRLENLTDTVDAGVTSAPSRRGEMETFSFEKFHRYYDAEPDRKWQVEVLNRLVKLVSLPADWDGYGAREIRRDAAMFALELLQHTMRSRTPVPQVVPSSDGGVQLEWHEKSIDLELHIAAPYDCEIWFHDGRDNI